MSARRAILGLVAVCAVIVVLSIVGFVADFATRLEFNIDGLLLLAVCLMMGGIFAVMLFLMAKDYGWLEPLRFLRKKSAAGAPAGNPKDSAAAKGK